MLDPETIERLRGLDAGGKPIVSVYIGLRPGVGTLRAISPRLKDLLDPIADRADAMDREDKMSVKADIEAILSMTGRIAEDLGRGVGIIRSEAAGIEEYLSLPAPVRDRAVVDTTPYMGPLDAMLDYFKRFAVVVVDRRYAHIFRFYQGELQTWEEMAEEEIRKDNFGGWYGLEEHRVRNRADEVLQRHYRGIGARLYQLWRDEHGFDLLIVGGHREHTEGLVESLHPDLAPLVAGTFTIDPGTMTPAKVLAAAAEVVDGWERRTQSEEVAKLLDVARSGGDAVLGLTEVVPRVNERAVDVLLVQGQTTRPGSRCPACGFLSINGEATCPVCGASMEDVPDILDAVAEAVREGGGEVHYVTTETELAPYEVGAFLRFKIPAELAQ